MRRRGACCALCYNRWVTSPFGTAEAPRPEQGTVSEAFNLGTTQAELDFVDVPIDADLPLFVDPFALSRRVDQHSIAAHATLCDYFQRLVDAIRAGNNREADALVSHLAEPNETHLGLSSYRPRGAGIGSGQSRLLLDALTTSTAVKTGFLKSLEECELMVEGIGRDKISDLTTNVIRSHLAEYTKTQCALWNIPTHTVALPPVYSVAEQGWVSGYHSLPVVRGRPLLLVPKAIVRHDPAVEHGRYYNDFVLNYLQAEYLAADSSLVHALRNGARKVYKKDLKILHPCGKKFLADFSRDHPEVLDEYRNYLAEREKRGESRFIDDDTDEAVLAQAMSAALRAIPPGKDDATTYHRLMIGVLEFIFFPSLLNPVKEREIHEGRKRIDIVMENGAPGGILHRLHSIRYLPCSYVPIECKNYGREVGNPELDQLAGRFSRQRGKLGFLCCRSLLDRALVVQRCRDAFKDERGLMVPLDDEAITEFLEHIARGQRQRIEDALAKRIDEIWYS
jgi:hypothetical protein